MEEATRGGLNRRDVLKRSAVVGGTLLWSAPVVQTFARPAFAQDVSPESTIVVLTAVGAPPVCRITTYSEPEDCSTCVSAEIAGGVDAFTAALRCFTAQRCLFTTPVASVPC